MSKKLPIKALLAGSVFTFLSAFSHATVVEIRTSLGPIQVNLFDNATPQTVANFLQYANPSAGAYVNNVVHRVDPNFVVQAGGFNYSGEFPKLDSVCPDNSCPSVINEPKLSNLRGTIAMAKLPSQVNSATSQWFINLANNSANLDVQNGGFTVFGQVLGDGMDVVDAIAAVNRFDKSEKKVEYKAFSEIPLRNYTSTDNTNNVEVTEDNLVIISEIVVSDPAVSTHPEIVPVTNTLINNSSNGGSDSGGGSFAWLSALALVMLGRRIYR